jgi:SAM-dependent methyltransferase
MKGYLKKLIRKALALYTRGFRYLLHFYFKFDKWHIASLYDRKYAMAAIRHLNGRNKETRNEVLEIGCGLGDIIRNLNYIRRRGYDLDLNALKAARFLSRITLRKKIDFEWFEFPGSPLKGQVDAIIMVNWIHHVPPPLLKTKIDDYFLNNLLPGGEIIIDTVQDKEYKFNHDIGYLVKDINAKVNKLGDYERQRTIWAIKKEK